MTISDINIINNNIHIRRWRNQPAQKEVRHTTIPAREAIEKMDKILDCIHEADIRINAIRSTKDSWIFRGYFFQHQIDKLDTEIENTKAAKLKLKKYFNKVARSIELFNLK